MAKNPTIKLGRGRPDKETRIALDTLESWLDLEKMVGEDVAKAYQVWRDILNDNSASVASKERVAKNVMELHAKFYKTRVKRVEQPDEEIDDEEETSVVFQWKQA